MGKYDQIFKTIFSDKNILIQFIEQFIPELYNLGIKPENIIQKNIEFADVKYGAQETDLLFEIKTEKTQAFLFLLLEHQSTVDNLMSFRILRYMIRIWGEYIKENEKISKRKNFKLPPIIPVVFYDGIREWKVEKNFKSKVEDLGKNLDKYIPKFEYEVIDVGRIGEEKIEKMKKAIGVLLGIDGAKKGGIEEIIEWIKKIYEELPKEEKEIVKRYMKLMLISLYGKEEIEKELEKVEEVKDMLRIIEERRRKELEEVEKRGIKKAKIELAKKLLLKKFGDKIKDFLPKIENLNNEQLEDIIENIFDITFDDLIEKYLNP